MGDAGEEDQQLPLLSSNESEEPLKRTGTIWTALAHIITGVIGAGVLSLAWSIAQLGWIAGPLAMIAFAAMTIVSTFLVCDCYRYPDPEYGPTRIRSYMQAVKFYLGEKSQQVCGVFAQESLYGCGIAYIITSASSIKRRLATHPPTQALTHFWSSEAKAMIFDNKVGWKVTREGRYISK